jgi:hypothetical protein
MLREGIWRARSALLLLLMLALVACGGDSGSPEGGSGDGRSSGRQESADGPGREKSTAAKDAGPQTTADRMETTGAGGERRSDGAGSGSKRDRRSGPVPSDALAAGATDATGGPLARGRMVSYYGHPLSGAMGVLGQLAPEALVRELKEQTEAYTRADPDRPAIPTIELIASVAQPTPGPDGLYLNKTEPYLIEKYAKLAEQNDCLLLLDIQIGYSTIEEEVETLLPYLERDYVHLAIDTEYDMIPPDIPAQQIGSSPGEDIMAAARTLSRLVEERDLPPKVLVIHQFESGMIQNKEMLRPVPNVEMVLHADGFGTPQQKFEKYDLLVRDEPIQYGGFKLFYDQDTPLLSPEQVLERLEPKPAVISYQ